MHGKTGKLTALILASAALSLLGCRNRKNVAERIMDDPAHELTSARCGGAGQIVRPLIIEWPATERASLEGRLRRGQVIVVRYEGCTVEVMRDCAVPETGYDYIGITRKNDRIAIRSSDELYVNMPLTAVKLEAKLAKAGELNVAMALVGNFEAQRSRFDITELEGRCTGATHVIAAAQIGAFQFFAGAAAEVGVGVEVESVVGAGGRSTASREVLNEDGNAASCELASPSDTEPPAECHALLRLELSALDGIIPSCQAGSVWTGDACVAQSDPRAPKPKRGRDQAPADPALEAESDLIAKQMCEIQMQCQAEDSGMLPPEGQVYARQIQTCMNMTRRLITDRTRPQARKCVSEMPGLGCKEFERCIMGPDPFAEDELDDDASDW